MIWCGGSFCINQKSSNQSKPIVYEEFIHGSFGPSGVARSLGQFQFPFSRVNSETVKGHRQSGSSYVIVMDENGSGKVSTPKRRKIETSPPPPPGPSRANGGLSSVPVSDVNDWQNLDGMIISVHLKNFMCHQEFHYEPSNCLNFLR